VRARAQATGVEFPEVVSLWGASDPFRSVGAGVRAKKFAFVPVKARAHARPPRLRCAWCARRGRHLCHFRVRVWLGYYTLPARAQVYAVTVYVEAEKAARELGVRSRGGFFEGDADEDYALALVDGAFAKALVVHLVRKVDGRTFYEARPWPAAEAGHCVRALPLASRQPSWVRRRRPCCA